MKKIISLIIMTTLSISMISSNVFATTSDFSDIHGHWAEETIIKWQDSGYISGYPDGTFKPDNPVTRAELSKILTSTFDLSEPQEISLDDVSVDDWYYPYLQNSYKYIPLYSLPTAYPQNLPYRENNSKNNFLPEENALRMHVAEALVEIKLEREPVEIEELSIFEMHDEIKKVFKDPDLVYLLIVHGGIIPSNQERMIKYAWLAYKLDIMVGSDGYFDPYGYMTRAELITAIDKVLDANS